MDWLEKLSLGAWKYRSILSKSGGPIERLASREIQLPTGQAFEVLAYLKPELTEVSQHQIYGSADGSGTDKRFSVACNKAISEALERWAFYNLCDSEHAKLYGFDREPSTTGMAAFPGLFRNSAKRIAYFEAIERWSLTWWWENGLPSRRLDQINGIELITPWSSESSTVILWTDKAPHAYGFAAGTHLKKAIAKAQIELQRNQVVLGNGDLPEVDSIQEKRLINFAREEGFNLFMKRVEKSKVLLTVPERPLLIINREVDGPWSRYATVWRCLFDPVSRRHLGSDVDYFLF